MMAVGDPSIASAWSPLCFGPNSHLSFGTSMDTTKLEEARMLLSRMDYSRATCQDEDGDT